MDPKPTWTGLKSRPATAPISWLDRPFAHRLGRLGFLNRLEATRLFLALESVAGDHYEYEMQDGLGDTRRRGDRRRLDHRAKGERASWHADQPSRNCAGDRGRVRRL